MNIGHSNRQEYDAWVEREVNLRAQMKQEIIQDLRAGGWRIVKLDVIGHAHKKQPGDRWECHTDNSLHMNDWVAYVATDEL